MLLVCGEALFDVFVGDETAHGYLPLDARPGGSPFNVAIGLARLGRPAALLTGLSNDLLGDRLAARLAAEGVATRYLVRSGRRTTLSLVGLDAAGVPAYTFYGLGSADGSLTDGDMPNLGPDVTGLHFGSYSIAVPPTADAFAGLADRERGRFISLDPNIRLNVEPSVAVWQARIDRLLPVASLVKVSEEDLALLAPGSAPEAMASAWLARGPAMVVVTRGAQGAFALTGQGRVDVPAQPVDIVDTVGAGDAFQAALLDGLSEMNALTRSALMQASRDQIEAVLARAALAAALACTRRGADLPRRAELEAFRPARHPPRAPAP